MKLKRTFKTLLMIIATVMSVISGILTDSGTLAYAATTYTLTLNWDDGVEWVATDRNGTDRWEKGGSKTFQAGSKAYTYVRLKNGATVKSFFSRQENKDWTDYTYTSGSLCYDTWTMYNNRNVDIYTSVSSSADVSYDWDNLVTGSKHYHSSNGNEASLNYLRDDLGRSPAPIYSIYYKLQENRYRETCYGDNQEDKDFGGYEIMLRTEDNHNSYWYGQSSYANGNGFDDWYRDEFEGIKLSNLAIVPVQIKGDKFLQINISIKNNNSYAKEISLATCSDIQIADDDNATTFFNGNGFTMTNMYCETSDNFPLGTIPTATLNVYAKDVPGYVTDADAVYIGHFVYRKQHIWLNNVLGDKTTYFNKKPHGGTSGEGESDSGFSIAWKNRTIAAGQTQTYSYIIGIGKYNSDNKITFDANGGELKTPGTNINNPSGNYSNKVTVTYGTDTYSSMSNDIPERAGYIFDGWWTTPNDSNASVMVYDASGKCNNDCNYWKNNQWQGTNDLTVYAHWKANTYTVRLNTGDIPSSELAELTETASTEGWTWNENGRYFSKAFIQNENNYLPGVNKFFSANNYESVGSKVTDKYFVQDKTKNPTKVLYNWWTSASGGTDIGRGEKTYNNLYEISKDNSGIVNLYPHWMGYTTVFNYTDTAPSNTAGQTVTINNNINDGIDNNLYQVYGSCFFYKGTDGAYHDYEGTNPDLKVTASIPNSNGYKYIFNGWHHKNWNYLTDGLGKLTYKNNYNIGQGKTSYSLSPHFTRTGINYNVRLHANVPENTESTLQVLHRNGISSYIYDSNSRYFSRELTYDDLQDMLSPDVYSLKGYHLISRSNWYTEKTGGNTVSAPCNNTEAEYPDWTEKNWNLTTTDGATVDLYARWQANNYKIAYNLDGGTYGTSHPTSVDYDTMVTIDNPSKTGYTFTGWTITGYDSTTSGYAGSTWTDETGTSYKNLTATDGATVTFTATWSKEAPKTAKYIVKHYKMDVNGNYPSVPDETENLTANIGSSVTPNTKDYGKLYNKPSLKTITVSSDSGQNVIEYRYSRKMARVILYKDEGIKSTDPIAGDYERDYVGATIKLSAVMQKGYKFKNWTSKLDYNLGTVLSTANPYNYTLTSEDMQGVTHTYNNGAGSTWGALIQANSTPITYSIAYNLNGGVFGAFHPTSTSYNEDVKISNPAKENCIFAGWTITGYDTETSGHSAATWTGETGASFKNLASTEGKTVTFTAVWNVATANFQTTGDTGIASTSHPNKTSENIGSSINVNAKLNNGYTFVGWYNGSTLVSDKMNFNYTMPNTDTVLTAKTTPAKYTISYDLNGGAVAVSNPTGYNIETPTFTLNNPVKIGYTFVGWTGSNGTTPQKAVSIYKGSTGNKSYKANWTANIDTKYTVEYYQMNLDGKTYTKHESKTFTGTTDTKVASLDTLKKTYTGFTYAYAENADAIIKGDGTTVVKYYYTRNKYTLDLNGLINGTLRGNLVDVVKNPITGAEDRHTAGTAVVTVNGTVVGNKVTDYCNEVYYGSSISIITTAESGYSIIDNSNVSFKMPAEGKTVTVTINAKDTKYLVRRWKKNVNTDSKTYNENSLNDSNYTIYDAEYLNGKAYSWVTPDIKTYEGFTYKATLPSEGTAYVKPDGTTVIDVYYTRNTYTINGGNVNANVEYGNGISSVSGLKTYEYEQKVTLTANLKIGYHWHGTDKCASSGKYPTGWYSRNNSGVDGILTDNTTYNSQTIKFNMPARNVYLKVKATNNSYTVVYNKNQPVEPKSINNVTGSTESQTFIYDESQNLRNNGFTLTGYTKKSGWMTASSKNGNGTADFSYGQSVKNLTTVNLGTVNLYAIWEDNAPEKINISSTNDFAATQTVTLTARDYGSGIDYISFGKDEKYEKVTCNADGSVTFTRKVNASGTYIFSVKDKNGKVSKKTITFYQTTLNTNKNNIVSSDGKNVIESDFTSVPETLSTYISINEAGKSITPVTKRNGVDFLGWSTDRKGKTGIISIKADGNKTYYAIWKDTINPLVVITDVSNKDADSQTIKFNLYDLDADLTDKDFEGKNLEYIRKHGEKTGSDIAAYWFGKNPVYNGNGNSRTVTEIVKDEGYSVNLERTVGEAVTYYIFAEDKAGNISRTTIAVDANGNVTPNNDLTFCSLTLNANDGLIQENGQNTIQKLIRKGNTYNLTNVHTERTGYHDTESDTDGVSMHWSHEIALGSNIIDEDKQTVIGTDNSVNPESLTEWEAKGNDTLYTKWTPNAYTLKVYLNKPVKATEDINTYNTVSSDTNKWVYDTYTGYYKTVLVYDKVWSIPDSAEFAGLTGWTTTGFKNVGKIGKSDIIYLNSLNRSYDEADDVSKASDIGTNLTSVKGDAVAYTMLWKENRYTVNFRANGGTAVKRVTLLEKKIDGSAKERTVDTTASANKKATDKTYDTSIIIGYESMIKVLDSPVRPGFTFTFFTKDKDYAKTAHMKDDKPDFDKSVLCTGELSEEAAKMYREEYKITGSLNSDEEVNLYSSWSKRKPVTLQSFISANSIRTDANALTKIALGTYITRDNAKDINSAWFNKNYKTNDKGEYVMNDTVEVLQEWDVTKTEIKQTYSKKIMADNN
jgi:uncharacterized repeat protein (TIGR02543 family)